MKVFHLHWIQWRDHLAATWQDIDPQMAMVEFNEIQIWAANRRQQGRWAIYQPANVYVNRQVGGQAQ